MTALLAMVWIAAAQESASSAMPADLVIRNANIYTVAAGRPKARAMAVVGSRIVAIGDDADVRPLVGPRSRVLDLGGKTVLPGLIDAHGHMLGLGNRLSDVNVVGTTSYAVVVARVAERAKQTSRGTWILGRGWDQNDWRATAMPHHEPLSRAVPDHPVRLTRIDGHAALVNRRAMELAGITRETPDPPGGAILRDARGEPTGVLVDNATGLVNSIIPAIEQPERERRLLSAMHECARLGLTMVHDAGIGEAEWAAYRTLLEHDTFPIRIYAMARAGTRLADSLLFAHGPVTGDSLPFPHGPVIGDRLSLRAIKVVADGALGSRGALLGAPYADDPGNLGLATFPLEQPGAGGLYDLGQWALRGVQVRVHAIGDSANHGTLDVFERLFEWRPRPDLRWAIEHAQIVRPDDIRRFARLGVVASMQPTHATSDGPWAESRLGPERVRWGYRWRDFLEAGATLVSGSDFPVESANPMLGLYAAVTRRDLDQKLPAGGWFPDQRLTREEALRSFTAAGAWLAFREADLGSLEVGKQADFVVLDRDVIAGPVGEVPKAKVLRTVVGGRTVFEGDGH